MNVPVWAAAPRGSKAATNTANRLVLYSLRPEREPNSYIGILFNHRAMAVQVNRLVAIVSAKSFWDTEYLASAPPQEIVLYQDSQPSAKAWNPTLKKN